VATPNPRFQIRLALEDLLAQGVDLLSYDPLAGLRQKDDSIKQVKQADVEMRKRTRVWADAVVSASQSVFSSPVLTCSSLVAPTGLYPNLEPLRELLEVFKPQEFLDASAPPSTVVYTFDVLHEEIRVRCQTHFGTRHTNPHLREGRASGRGHSPDQGGSVTQVPGNLLGLGCRREDSYHSNAVIQTVEGHGGPQGVGPMTQPR
jgi:hypothetical protein